MRKMVPMLSLLLITLFIVVSPIITARSILDEQKTVTILEGDYLALPFQLERADEIYYSFEITEGPRIGVFILTDNDFVLFQNGHRFNAYNPQLNVTSGSNTFWIPGDSRYYLTFDNSNRSEANPWDNNSTRNVTLSYSIETTIGPVILIEDVIGWAVVILIAVTLVIMPFYIKRKEIQTTNHTTSDRITKQHIPLIVRWRYMKLIKRGLRKKWLSGHHKHLFYIGCLIVFFSGLTIIAFNEKINLTFIEIFMLLTLTSLILYYEILRLIHIEWKKNKFISSIIAIVAIIFIDLLISIDYGTVQTTNYFFTFYPLLIIMWVIVILEPFDLYRVKDREIIESVRKGI